MAVTYFDSSALVKLLIDEPDSEVARSAWDACDVPVSSRLAQVEVRAALASSHRNHDLTAEGLIETELAWADFWGFMAPIDLSEAIAGHAGDLAGFHSLSGADAVHLASALAVGTADLTVAVWDRRLHRACRAAGLAVAPAEV
jgi:uncharacterized protein